MNQQEAQQKAQGQTAGIAHKELVSPACIAEHIVAPERNEDAQGGQCQNDIDVLGQQVVHVAHHKQGNAAQTGGQSVDAVYQVDGIGDIDNEEYGERNADPCRKVVDAEQSAQRINPVAAADQQEGGENLDQEFLAVAYSDKVVLHPDEVEQHGAHQPEQKFVEGAVEGKMGDRNSDNITYPHDQGEGDDDGGQERESAQTGYWTGMYLAGVRHVEQAFFVGYQQDVGYHNHAQQNGNDKTANKKEWYELHSLLCRNNFD